MCQSFTGLAFSVEAAMLLLLQASAIGPSCSCKLTYILHYCVLSYNAWEWPEHQAEVLVCLPACDLQSSVAVLCSDCGPCALLCRQVIYLLLLIMVTIQ